MGYYAGGYYAGGYYAGGVFGFLKRVGGAAINIVGSALTGASLGKTVGVPAVPAAIGGAVVGTVSAVGSGIQQATLEAGGTQTAWTPDLIAKHNAALARGSTAGPLPQIAGPAMPMGIPMGAPGMGLIRGLRPNKSTYVTRGGGTSRWPGGLLVHPAHTEWVKGRRMNVANPRALRRALRRAQGFAKLARRFIAVTHRFKKGRKSVRRR